MSDKVTEAPLPLAIRHLIELHNIRLRDYQKQSLQDIQSASVELMLMMGLSPEDGWRLDIENMKYIKVSVDESTSDE